MKKWIQTAVAVLSAGILTFLYWDWIQEEDVLSIPQLLASLASALLFYICLQLVFSKTYDFLFSKKPSFIYNVQKETRKHHWLQILLWMAISRLLLYALSLFFAWLNGKWGNSLFSTLQSIWTASTDANSYLGIAENWYVTEGDPRFHIVFFPFYPIIIKLFQLVLQNYFVSAIVVSHLCSYVAALLLYELAALDMPSEKALQTVKYFFLLPAAIFFAAPMTESLFLLLSLSCIYFVRKGRYLPACLLGALAAFTRSPGVLLLVIIFIEYVKELIAQYRFDGNRFRKRFWNLFFGRGACMLIIPLGLLGYILINYLVTGNPFQFSIYQDMHWNQRLGYFFGTAATQMGQIFSNIKDGTLQKILGLWGTNVFCFFGSLLLMLFASKKIRPSYSAYYLVYFAITLGVSWLLSAPRYLTVVFPLAFAISALVKNKWADRIVSALLLLFQICYLAMFIGRGFHIY